MTRIFYTTIKYTGLLSNLIYMLLGIGIISVAGFELQYAKPNTAEHTYFIESIVLGGMICMIVIFGCYGLVTDLLGVNLIFTSFLLIILAVQYVQMQSYQPHSFYNKALDNLDHAWQQLENSPNLMQRIEAVYQCCGYNNAHDYKYLHLNKPATCYQHLQADDVSKLYAGGCLAAMNNSYQYATTRERLLNYFTIGLEFFILLQTMLQSILIYKMQYQREIQLQPQRSSEPPTTNHIGSRSNLISNEV